MAAVLLAMLGERAAFCASPLSASHCFQAGGRRRASSRELCLYRTFVLLWNCPRVRNGRVWRVNEKLEEGAGERDSVGAWGGRLCTVEEGTGFLRRTYFGEGCRRHCKRLPALSDQISRSGLKCPYQKRWHAPVRRCPRLTDRRPYTDRRLNRLCAGHQRSGNDRGRPPCVSAPVQSGMSPRQRKNSEIRGLWTNLKPCVRISGRRVFMVVEKYIKSSRSQARIGQQTSGQLPRNSRRTQSQLGEVIRVESLYIIQFGPEFLFTGENVGTLQKNRWRPGGTYARMSLCTSR